MSVHVLLPNLGNKAIPDSMLNLKLEFIFKMIILFINTYLLLVYLTILFNEFVYRQLWSVIFLWSNNNDVIAHAIGHAV